MKPVIDWFKQNVLSVVFMAIMLAAILVLPFLAASQNASIQEEVRNRAREMARLQALEGADVEYSIAGQQVFSRSNVVVNHALIQQFEQLVDTVEAEANAIYELVVERNRRGRSPLHAAVFPSPDERRSTVLRREFYQKLRPAYQDILRRIGAGSPIPMAQLHEELLRHRANYIGQMLHRSPDAELTADEEERVREEMTRRRMNIVGGRARSIRLYADMSVLEIPVWPEVEERTMVDAWTWQWDYWLQEDILLALGTANAEYESVTEAPVKRIRYINPLDGLRGDARRQDRGTPRGGAAPPTFGSGGPMMGGGGGGGGADRGGQPGGQPDAPRSAPTGRTDLTREIPLDYAKSFTGRQTNSAYDVRYVQVGLIVDSERLTDVFEAFAERNFITVLSASIREVDQFAEMRTGYYYGPNPVVEVDLLIETIWIREWMKPYMPPSVRELLGIPAEGQQQQQQTM